jgi:hypothetical protein
MKKVILCCLLGIFSYFSASAQVDNAPWSPAGATWLYSMPNYFGAQIYYKLTYQSDMVFANRSVKKMVLTEFEIVPSGPPTALIWTRSAERFRSNIFMYASNDSIFWYNDSTSRFQLLYVFSATVGNAWTVKKGTLFTCPRGTADSSVFVTQSVQTRTFDNRQFTTISANPSPYPYIGAVVVKNIGSLYSFLPVAPGSCIDFIAPSQLPCYRDNIRGTINFAGFGDCNGLITASQELASREMNTLRIVPNPANDQIVIKNYSNLQIKEVKIVDMLGKTHYTVRQYNDGEAIDVAFLSNGVYVVQLVTTENVVYATRLVKVK